jgi:hypothetical protein
MVAWPPTRFDHYRGEDQEQETGAVTRARLSASVLLPGLHYRVSQVRVRHEQAELAAAVGRGRALTGAIHQACVEDGPGLGAQRRPITRMG